MSEIQSSNEINKSDSADGADVKSGSCLRTCLMVFVLGIVLLVGGLVALWAMGGSEIEFVTKLKIKAPEREVFEVLIDGDLVKKWVTGVTDVEEVGDVKGSQIGAQSKVTIEAEGNKFILENEVVKFQKNREFELKMDSEVFKSTNHFMLAPNFDNPEDGDVTEVTQTYRVKFTGITRIFVPFMKSTMEQQIKSDLGKLKQLVETGKVETGKVETGKVDGQEASEETK